MTVIHIGRLSTEPQDRRWRPSAAAPDTSAVMNEFEHQGGMISHAQAMALGYTPDQIRSRLDRGLWQRTHRGIYAGFSGPLSRKSIMWGVVLAGGEGATLTHYSAAELQGFIREPRRLVHVSVPWPRTAPKIDSAVVRVSRRLGVARHPSRQPPQTRVEETVLDLVDVSATADEAVAWVVAACSRRLITSRHIGSAMAARSRLKWRRELVAALKDVDAGAYSLLEIRYMRDVERAHRLPPGKRQARQQRLGGAIYDDVLYPEFGLVAELDGRADHPAQTRFRDLNRDNVAGARGDVVLHFGWADVTTAPRDRRSSRRSAHDSRLVRPTDAVPEARLRDRQKLAGDMARSF